MKKIIISFALLISLLFFPNFTYANSNIDDALNYLKSKQDSSGKINTGFSAPSQWSTIAFSINGIDISTVKNGDKSLRDYLLTNTPSDQSSSTDWENRILSIVAIGEDPTNFGGVNYIQKLESFYSENQIGDTCSLNDDIFGLLALVAVKEKSTTQIKQGVLDFIIQKQDSSDGGFGFSAPGCSWYSTSTDITGAAIQALQEAKNNNLTNPGLENAIEKAKNYLLTNQDADGGFGYYGSSDTDTTGWVLMAFNVLGLKDSIEATKAREWLLTQQSGSDGGFQAFDWGANSMLSNATTTAQAVIALSGYGWIYHPVKSSPTPTPLHQDSAGQAPTETPTPTLAVNTPTPTPTPSNSCQDSKPDNAPIITSATILNKNEVVLNWSKSSGSVSYYFLTYGTSPDKFEYGNPNIGGKDVVSYTVGSLQTGVTYYFRIRAGNGCTPGDFSNTAIVTINPQESISSITIAPTAIPTQTPRPTEKVLGETTQNVVESESKKSPVSSNKEFMSFSLLSFVSAIGYWYLKLRI